MLLWFPNFDFQILILLRVASQAVSTFKLAGAVAALLAMLQWLADRAGGGGHEFTVPFAMLPQLLAEIAAAEVGRFLLKSALWCCNLSTRFHHEATCQNDSAHTSQMHNHCRLSQKTSLQCRDMIYQLEFCNRQLERSCPDDLFHLHAAAVCG